ncbi:type I DNA topoisomerase, partial [Fusobacterium sp.]|uniref:type I DNA topoisomerase n=1 Tax=Fusobacterium sp. TaxID=68766 RepID=UPI002603F544
NTSAGRVQSVALKLICELEDEIKAFIPEKYWDINGEFQDKINLALYKVDGKKIDKLKDEKVVEKIKTLKGEEFLVDGAKVSKKTKNPPLPLKTSTLQQLSSSYLGFSATKTMKVAQGLYEGININGTHKGLITYMRTDSVRISEEAVEMAKEYILENYGKEYVGSGIKKSSKKQENIQDAHEGIRPTDVNYTPEYLSKFLDKDQLKLYTLIWERFLISQLAPMKYEQFELLCSKEGVQFRGVLNKILFDGYYKLFKDEEDIPLGDFPSIKEDDLLKLMKLNIKEDYTKPPARLTESSLIKKLESDGIGRPSTYASIINTLKDREYVTLKGKSFIPTELGYQVKEVLNENFRNFMNVKFTADMENKLDDIAEGKEKWQEILKKFYDELAKYISEYKKIVDEDENKIIVSDMPCPCGGGYMIMKNGRFGRYLACSKDECKQNISLRGIDIPMEDIKAGKIFVKDIVEQKIAEKKGKMTDVVAENGAKMLLKFGRFGSYLESENYTEDNIRTPLPSEIKKALALNEIPEEDGIVRLNLRLKAIKDEENSILSKAGVCEKCGRPFRIGKGRWGKYLACTGYPECKNIKNLDKDGNIIEKKEKEEPKKKKK